jgi:hypothetical protein
MHLRRPIAAAAVAAAMIACFAVAATAASLASYDHAPVSGPWSLAPGEYYVDIAGTSFQTSSGYDADGKRVSLGRTTEQRSFRSYMELGWKKNWNVQLSIPYVTQSERPFGGAGVSATGLEDFGVGLRYRLANGPGAAALQFYWETPAGYNHALSPSLGDGLQKLSATVQLGNALGKHAFWQLGGGYRYQYLGLTGLKDQVMRKPALWKWPEHMVANGALAVTMGNVQAAGLFATDVSSYLPNQESSKVTSVAAGTRLTYRTDGRLDVFAGSWHTPSGRNALALNQYYAGIAWKSTKLTRLQGFLGGDARP